MCAKCCLKRHFVSTVNICMQTKNGNPFQFYFLNVYCYSEGKSWLSLSNSQTQIVQL